MNPYEIDPPFMVSFSGGRTSAFMLRNILDAYGGSLPDGGYVLFANTGKDIPTYAQMLHQIKIQPELFNGDDDEPIIPCTCTD